MIPVSNGFNHGEIQLIMAGLPKSGFHLKILKNGSNKEITLL
ncbi:hypothetical protein HWC54_gp214 [Klebsiella phage Marfa]|uniref:Uncharacterized protein n=1 Tax=Klebsiella phage Marfa TaxID=2587809 RepID=A0A4Y5TR50_9CAUD|nr:hypothetical protein HWC54_gp214 [Klebsiella phage Marfa]QDB71858.1 hypothetical protein CPT_Marfa_213 [Klebsiella phage Marfa]